MTGVQIFSAAIALAGAAFFLVGVIYIICSTQRRHYQGELAPLKHSPSQGVWWAFTSGMAPWAKQSARIHWLAYVRGILFHVCIFTAAAFLVATPWLALMPALLRLVLFFVFIAGAVLMLIGIVMRLREPTLKLLSTPDDYFALVLTALFLATAAMAAISNMLLPVFWCISGLTLAYAPLGKLRHFIYFFYARFFLGSVFGRRGVLE